MKQTTELILRFFTLAMLLIFVAGGCGKNEKVEHSEEEQHAEGEQHTEDSGEHSDEHAEEGNTVHLDRHKVFHAGVKVEPVERKTIAVPLDLPGHITLNERRVAHISTRIGGRVEKVNAFTNDRVKEGAILVELYSQEFATIQFEFLRASERMHNTQTGGSPEELSTTKAIYESARRRLVTLGIPAEEIRQIETTGTPSHFFNVRAPFSGTILESTVRPGEMIETGKDLFDIADLSTLWVLADIYEKDLSRVKADMKAAVVVSAYPNEEFPGKVTTIYNVVDEKTRTVKARVEVSNSSGKLKPEMFSTVRVQTEFGKETIKIPASALLGESEKHFVFIAVNDTTFEKRDVRTGRETREFAEVLDGLMVGEKLVTKGGFFLKSELAKETFGEEHGH